MRVYVGARRDAEAAPRHAEGRRRDARGPDGRRAAARARGAGASATTARTTTARSRSTPAASRAGTRGPGQAPAERPAGATPRSTSTERSAAPAARRSRCGSRPGGTGSRWCVRLPHRGAEVDVAGGRDHAPEGRSWSDRRSRASRRRSATGAAAEELVEDAAGHGGGAVAVAVPQEHHDHELRLVGRRVRREPARAPSRSRSCRRRRPRDRRRRGAAFVDRAQEAGRSRPSSRVPGGSRQRSLGMKPSGPPTCGLSTTPPLMVAESSTASCTAEVAMPSGVAREVARPPQGCTNSGTRPAVSPVRLMPDGLAEPEQLRVALDLLVAELLADPLEVGVARDGQGAPQADGAVAGPRPAALAAVVGGVGRDDALREARDPDDDLEHRAGLIGALHPERRVHERAGRGRCGDPWRRPRPAAARAPLRAASPTARSQAEALAGRTTGRRRAARAARLASGLRPTRSRAPSDTSEAQRDGGREPADGSARGRRLARTVPAHRRMVARERCEPPGRARKINRSKKQGELRCAHRSIRSPSSWRAR